MLTLSHGREGGSEADVHTKHKEAKCIIKSFHVFRSCYLSKLDSIVIFIYSASLWLRKENMKAICDEAFTHFAIVR